MQLPQLRLFLCLATLSSAPSGTFGWRHFWRGRHSNGNLGEPSPIIINSFSDPPLPSDEWFTQNLDHFDATNDRTWQQRFYTNNAYYKEGGPVFLMIGGEGEATAKWMVQGAWIQYAKEHDALCFQLEHRFYGKSHPTEDLSTENLSFLSSEQALADLANFIVSMNEKYNFDMASIKWIAFGGSYPGSLAAWLREKYPHLVHGSVSSSGPLLAKADFREYYEVVTASLASYSRKCVDAIQKGTEQVELLLLHMVGQRNINEKFMLCDPVEKSIENPLDISNLFEALASNFAGVVQYNKDYSPHASVTIDVVCDVMMNQTFGAPVARLAEVNRILLVQQGEKCLDYKYDKMIEDMKNTSWTSKASDGMRQWTYQTCTEFGFYQTCDNRTVSIFGKRFDVDFFIRMCTDVYGPQFTADLVEKSIRSTNTYYGELHAKSTNVIYVHGSIDPWHALGLTHSRDAQMPTIYIQGTAHCANMYEPQKNDFPQLKEARIEINKFIDNLIHI